MLNCSLQPMKIISADRLRLSLTTAEPCVCFAKVHAISLHHEAVDVSAFAASSQTVPELFLWIHDEARLVVFVERTQTDKLLASTCELHPAPPNKSCQVTGSLHPLDLRLVDQHLSSLSALLEKPVKWKIALAPTFCSSEGAP
jgi:hypothetical protein